MSFNVPVLTEEELADVFAVFQAADRSSQSPMSISLMAERMFAALDARERDPIRLTAAVLDRPVEQVPGLNTLAARQTNGRSALFRLSARARCLGRLGK